MSCRVCALGSVTVGLTGAELAFSPRQPRCLAPRLDAPPRHLAHGRAIRPSSVRLFRNGLRKRDSILTLAKTGNRALTALLNQRDNLSLELLRLRSDINKLALERLKLRKKLVGAWTTCTLSERQCGSQSPRLSLLTRCLEHSVQSRERRVHRDPPRLTNSLILAPRVAPTASSRIPHKVRLSFLSRLPSPSH